MSLAQILIVSIIQGAAELLPVSSSAHVIVAERLMGLDPSSPELTFLLVMLHTGTMFAVLVYFWRRWAKLFRQSRTFIRSLVIASAVTGVVGLGLKFVIEKIIFEKIMGQSQGEIESLFQNLPLIAINLLAVGFFIVYAAKKAPPGALQPSQHGQTGQTSSNLTDQDSVSIGLVQAICLPLRGLSRSGATISAALIRKISRPLAEDFSFALAVILTPAVILLELHRLHRATEGARLSDFLPLLQPGLVGMLLSFLAGLAALKWLSGWLENGKWAYFGYYCLAAGAVVMGLSHSLSL